MLNVYLVYSGKREPAQYPKSTIYDYESDHKPLQIITARDENVCKKKIKLPENHDEYIIIYIGYCTAKKKAFLWDKFLSESANFDLNIFKDIEWLPYLPTIAEFKSDI